MSNYTTFDYEKNEFRNPTQFVNSWKWSPDDKEYTSSLLAAEFGLPKSTPPSAFAMLDQYKQKVISLRELLTNERLKNQELVEVIKIASKDIKSLKQKITIKNKEQKEYRQGILPFVTHKSNCDIYLQKAVGRLHGKAKCTCGLNKIK